MSELSDRHRQFCEFALYFRNLSPRTVESYRDSMKQYLRYSDAQHVGQITKKSVIDWIVHARNELGWAPKTVHIRIGDLKAFVKWCIEEGYMVENPLLNLPLPRIPYKEPEFFNEEELDHILDVVRNYPYHNPMEKSRAVAVFAVFIMTGIRKKELLNLRMEDVVINSSIHDERYIYVNQGKGRRSRTVYFHPSLIEPLRDYLRDRKKLGISTPYFFASVENNIPMNLSVMRRLFSKISKASGMNIAAHKLRHSYATHVLSRGILKHKASRLLGHAHGKSIEVYTHVCDEELRRDIDARGYSCTSGNAY